MPPYALQDGHSPAEVQTAAAAPQHDPSAEPAPEVRWSALLPTRGNELAAVDELTGPQLAQAQEVFLAAFSREELAQVVFFSVRRRYEEIVARGTFEDEVFELLLWADRQGKVADLVTTARSRNPSNGKLRRLAQSLGLR